MVVCLFVCLVGKLVSYICFLFCYFNRMDDETLFSYTIYTSTIEYIPYAFHNNNQISSLCFYTKNSSRKTWTKMKPMKLIQLIQSQSMNQHWLDLTTNRIIQINNNHYNVSRIHNNNNNNNIISRNEIYTK